MFPRQPSAVIIMRDQITILIEYCALNGKWPSLLLFRIMPESFMFRTKPKERADLEDRKSNYESVHCQSYDFWKIPADCHEISRDSQLVFSETGNRLHSTFIIR